MLKERFFFCSSSEALVNLSMSLGIMCSCILFGYNFLIKNDSIAIIYSNNNKKNKQLI